MERNQLPDEARLVARLREGDDAAFRAIYDFYWHDQYRLALYKLGSREIAEELTQEVFTSLWQRRALLDPAQPIAYYLFGAMKNQVLNAWRKNNSREKYLHTLSQQPDNLVTDNTLEAVISADLYRALIQQIDALPDKCREVFVLSRIKGYTVQQIADELRISPKTVNNHLVKALRLMRLHLKDYMPLLVWLMWEHK